MSAPKVLCPGCDAPLNITVALPAHLRCPLCQARFTAAADGTAALNTESAAPSLSNGRAVALATVFGGSALFMLTGVALLAYCLLPSNEKKPPSPDEADEPPMVVGSKRPKDLPIEPVAFVKKSPRDAGKGIGGFAKERPDADSPAGTPKDASSPQSADDPKARSNQKEINAAIDKGVAYLKRSLDNGGHFGGGANHTPLLGTAALTGLTLLSCDVAKNDPKVVGIVERVRKEAPRCNQTYEISCCIWFLDRYDTAVDRSLIRQLTLRLIAGQRARGGWDYICQPLTAPQDVELLELLETGYKGAGVKAASKQPPPKNPPKIGKQVPKKDPKVLPVPPRGLPSDLPSDLKQLPILQWAPGQALPANAAGHEDNSLTQFAILALWAGQRSGIPAHRSLAMAEARFRLTQNAAGTWGYTNALTRLDSMTCAGLIGLAVGRGVDKSKAPNRDFGKDPQVEKALTYLGTRIGPNGKKASPQAGKGMNGKNQGKTINADAWGDYYFLWSLERVAVVLNLETIGGKDWYGWGSEIIVSNQSGDGSWNDAFRGPVDTCFALLFLKRVNVAVSLTEAIQGLGGVTDPGGVRPTVKPATPTATLGVLGDPKPNPTLLPGVIKPRPASPAVPAQSPRPSQRRRSSKHRVKRTRRAARVRMALT